MGDYGDCWTRNGGHSSDFKISFHFFYFALALLYLLISSIAAFQIIRMLYYKHNIQSYRFVFLVLCFLWAISRFTFFFFQQSINFYLPIATLLYWIGFYIQFALFSLLVMFYASIAHHDNWRRFAKPIKIVFVVVNIIFIVISFAFVIGFPCSAGNGSTYKTGHIVQAALLGTIFLILVLVLGCYAGLLFMKLTSQDQLVAFVPWNLPQKVSNWLVLILTVVIVIIYITRTIFDFAQIFGVAILIGNNASNSNSISSSATNSSGAIAFVLFTLWEIIPNFIVLLLFWKIPKTNLGVMKSLPPTTPLRGNDPNWNQSNDADFFMNDQRYDDNTYTVADSSLLDTEYQTPYSTHRKSINDSI